MGNHVRKDPKTIKTNHNISINRVVYETGPTASSCHDLEAQQTQISAQARQRSTQQSSQLTNANRAPGSPITHHACLSCLTTRCNPTPFDVWKVAYHTITIVVSTRSKPLDFHSSCTNSKIGWPAMFAPDRGNSRRSCSTIHEVAYSVQPVAISCLKEGLMWSSGFSAAALRFLCFKGSGYSQGTVAKAASEGGVPARPESA